MSPKYSTKSDMFSYSVILWEVCHWKMAFVNLDMYEIKDIIKSGERLPIHEAIPKSFESIITCAWDQEQLKRPTFTEIQAFLEVVDFSEDVSNENCKFLTNHQLYLKSNRSSLLTHFWHYNLEVQFSWPHLNLHQYKRKEIKMAPKICYPRGLPQPGEAMALHLPFQQKPQYLILH